MTPLSLSAPDTTRRRVASIPFTHPPNLCAPGCVESTMRSAYEKGFDVVRCQ